ncbi:phosphotriesterase-related protein [Prorops nasuta]|uniref:phosphotriesterase-related protein n=1 Tax=Prorops nasuta TaxID=863751 RepID=UPI0034CF6355
MASSGPSDYVQTILGPVPLNNIGKTLTHEHLSLDFTDFYVEPPRHLKTIFKENIQLHNVGIYKQYPYSSKYNVIFNDEDTAKAVIKDIDDFYKAGGNTIVENSCHGLKRNVSFMIKVSAETKVNILLGTGFYVAATQSPDTLAFSEENMYKLIRSELEERCLDFEGRAAFIGEVGSTWPISDFEKRSIRATGLVQEVLKCPVTFHPGRDAQAPFEIMRIYQEAGGDGRKAIMSHLDRTLTNEETLLEFADEFNCYCQFDLFGTECSFYQLNPTTDMPSDAERLDFAKKLRDEKQLDRILLSHDIHTKHRLISFGGHGYSHIINNVVPKMRIKGFTEEEIDCVLVQNPKNWLTTFVK